MEVLEGVFVGAVPIDADDDMNLVAVGEKHIEQGGDGGNAAAGSKGGEYLQGVTFLAGSRLTPFRDGVEK